MTKAQPFRFGVVAESAPSREAWIELVHRAENLGYATFLLADHYVNEFPPIAALMAAADAARTIRIGSFVFDNDFRHPALLAKEVATLDLLSGGRFELGIGAGWHRPEYENIGLPFESAGVCIGIFSFCREKFCYPILVIALINSRAAREIEPTRR